MTKKEAKEFLEKYATVINSQEAIDALADMSSADIYTGDAVMKDIVLTDEQYTQIGSGHYTVSIPWATLKALLPDPSSKDWDGFAAELQVKIMKQI